MISPSYREELAQSGRAVLPKDFQVGHYYITGSGTHIILVHTEKQRIYYTCYCRGRGPYTEVLCITDHWSDMYSLSKDKAKMLMSVMS